MLLIAMSQPESRENSRARNRPILTNIPETKPTKNSWQIVLASSRHLRLIKFNYLDIRNHFLSRTL